MSVAWSEVMKLKAAANVDEDGPTASPCEGTTKEDLEQESMVEACRSTVLALLGLQMKALAEEEEVNAARLLADSLEIRLCRLETKVQQHEESERLERTA
jgi:hypothetical protein